MKFNELKITHELLKAIDEIGYTEMTPIQEKAIPLLLKGNDLMGCAQTGTGKTCAFALPILNQMKKGQAIKALVLAPTRELALQIYENFVAYGKYLNLRSVVIYGGVKQRQQEIELSKGADILIATPGRLNDLMNQGIISLKQIEYFVLDEADRMLDMGFIHDVRKIARCLPVERQTMMFSATFPKAIKRLAHELLNEPEYVQVTPPSSTVDLIRQEVMFVEKSKKKHALFAILQNHSFKNVLVFTRTKHLANRIVRDLEANGIQAMAIHGNKSQNQRQAALSAFKEGGIRVLVATDIAARGIDIDDLSVVVNYDLPNISETYVHRIGRTGRAKKQGIAISFCDEDEKGYLADIEKLIKKKLIVMDVPVVDELKIVKVKKNKPVQKQGSKKRKLRASDKINAILEDEFKKAYKKEKKHLHNR